ncbi:MAG: lipopolysaccharide biosynthesis protein [Chloroflexota bacterium]
MQNQNLKHAMVRGAFWAYTSNYSGKLLVFISTAVLARLLLKEDFGIAGYALVVMSFMEVLEGLGIGPAIIYHQNDPKRLNTAFWMGLGIGVVLFGLTWFVAAPLAGSFFRDANAVPVTRALGLEFIIGAFSLVHAATLTKKLAFGRKFVPDVSRSASKGIASIVLALLGFGAWSLILGHLVGVLVQTVVYWIVVPWRPAWQFQRKAAQTLLAYGSNIVSIDALGILMLNMDYLVIGRYMGAAALGVYTLAFRVPELLVKQVCQIVSNVTFPVYSQMRDDPQALRRAFLLTTRYLAMIVIPLGLGLALVAEPFVLTFFTEKWAEAIPVMAAISIYTLLRSLVFNAGSVYKATGQPGLLSRQSMVQAIVTVPALWWVAVTYNTIMAVAWMQVLLALSTGIVKMVIAARLVNIPLWEMAKTFFPSLLAGSLMALAVLVASQFLNDVIPVVELVLETAVGALVYGSAIFLMQPDDMRKVIKMLRTTFLRKAKTVVAD